MKLTEKFIWMQKLLKGLHSVVVVVKIYRFWDTFQETLYAQIPTSFCSKDKLFEVPF